MQTNPKQSEFVPIFLIFLTCLSKLKKKKEWQKAIQALQNQTL